MLVGNPFGLITGNVNYLVIFKIHEVQTAKDLKELIYRLF